MRVLKFGGSSLADADRIRRAATLVATAATAGRVLVVVSAIGDTTDLLVDALDAASSGDGRWRGVAGTLVARHKALMAELDGEPSAFEPRFADLERLLAGLELLGECPAASRDRVLATGERCSIHLLGAALAGRGVACRVVDPTAVVVTDSTFGGAEVDRRATASRLDALLAGAQHEAVLITGGYVGADASGRVTTLGRGGSDLSATLLGALGGAEVVEIWTDVRGVHTAPPGLVPEARPLPELGYAAAAELAAFGAAVLHQRCVEPAADAGVPIVVRSTLDPTGPSTLISAAADGADRVHAVAALDRVVVVHGAGEGFPLLGARALVLVVDPRRGRWSAVLREEDAAAAAATVGAEIREDLALVALVGEDLATRPWISGRALESLGRHGIPVERVLAGASEHSLVVLVPRAVVARALDAIHAALQLGRLADRAADRHRRPAA